MEIYHDAISVQKCYVAIVFRGDWFYWLLRGWKYGAAADAIFVVRELNDYDVLLPWESTPLKQ